MSLSNGSEGRTIGRKGRLKFRLAEDTEWVYLDVLGVSNQWQDIVEGYRGEDGKIAVKDNEEINSKAVQFATELLKAPTTEPDCLTLTEALQFIKMIVDESEKLRPFFVRESSEPQSSPGNTELILLAED